MIAERIDGSLEFAFTALAKLAIDFKLQVVRDQRIVPERFPRAAVLHDRQAFNEEGMSALLYGAK